MTHSKKSTLKSLLESKDGIHFTAYLVNSGKLSDLKNQLRTTINEAYFWLNPVMTPEALKKFLEPIENLIQDPSIIRKMTGNVGIFRNKDYFRVLNIPIEIEAACQVATSFHVKPLLRWLQSDTEFLLLGTENESVNLYFGTQHSVKLIDTILFPKTADLVQQEEMTSIINGWLSQLTKHSKPRLFLAGDASQTGVLKRILKYTQMVRAPLANVFNEELLADICSLARQRVTEEAKRSFEKALLEFRFAEEDNRVTKNIFQITQAVVEGRVRKLIVTDEVNIFGKIDSRSGALSIHPCDMDHEDDDILDDLAQMVLSQGGKVIIARKDEIPQGRPILAILDDAGISNWTVTKKEKKMITIKFKNLDRSDMIRDMVNERIEALVDKFPDLDHSKIQVTLEMENSPIQAGPDLFRVKVHIARGRYDGVTVEKTESSLFVALAEVIDHMLERLNRFGDRNRVKQRNISRKIAKEAEDRWDPNLALL